MREMNIFGPVLVLNCLLLWFVAISYRLCAERHGIGNPARRMCPPPPDSGDGYRYYWRVVKGTVSCLKVIAPPRRSHAITC